MQRPDRLTEIVNQVSIGLPREFKITIFNAEVENSYEFTTSSELVLIQPFAPFFDKLHEFNITQARGAAPIP